jgi:hypothetical protein
VLWATGVLKRLYAILEGYFQSRFGHMLVSRDFALDIQPGRDTRSQDGERIFHCVVGVHWIED